MAQIQVTCPYCETSRTIPHDGLFTPRYVTCLGCDETYIYEPRAGYVAFFKKGEAECCSDPECRALEMSSHGEE